MSLNDRAMLVDLTFHSWGGYKHDKKVSQEVADSHKSDVTMGRYNKQLIPREAFNNIWRVGRMTYSEYITKTLPWLDSGWRILSSASYFKFAEKMRVFENEWEAAVDEFVAQYPTYINEAENRLGGLFDKTEYPDPKRIRNKFGFGYRISPLPAADDFRVQLTDQDVAIIKDNIRNTEQEAIKAASRDIAERIERVVGHMLERLKAVDDADSRGIFRDSLVSNVQELAQLVPEINVMEDPMLNELARRMNDELCAFLPQQLRENDNSRATTRQAAQEILDQLEAYVA